MQCLVVRVGRSWRANTLAELGFIPWEVNTAPWKLICVCIILHLLILNIIPFCTSLHKLEKVPDVLLLGLAATLYDIMGCNDAKKAVSDLVHVNLEDILTHLDSKGHVQEPIPTFMVIEGGYMRTSHPDAHFKSHL